MPRLNYTINQLEEKAQDARRNIVTALGLHAGDPLGSTSASSPGSALAAADLLTVLFFYEINFKPGELNWPERDIWHVSSRALTPALYAVLAEVGFFPARDLLAMGTVDHPLQGYPSAQVAGVEVSGGVPGNGLSVAVGAALASKMDRNPRRVYCVLDDSEIQEGQVWEAVMAAAQFELDNLVLVVDLDGRQTGGDIEEIIGLAPLAEKLRAFNWHVLEVDGNDLEKLVDGFNRTRGLKGAPSAILSCTTHGHGVSVLEDADKPFTDKMARQAIVELGSTWDDWKRRLEAGDGARTAARR